MVWALAAIVAMLVLAALVLKLAIARNGAAVLDGIDRLAGGGGTAPAIETRYGEHQAQRLYIHRATGMSADDPQPVLIFFHGGSWRSGDPRYYDFVGRAFTARGLTVVNVGYRLGEEGRFPAMLEDGAAAIRWVHGNIARHGGDPDRIHLMGHSAGAYNAVMLALDQQWLAREGLPPGAIKGAVGLAGPYDFHPFDTDASKAAFGHAEQPETTQPVNHARADAPPLLLIHGEKDVLVKPRNSRALERRMAEAGAAAISQFHPEMDHYDPLVSLAAPWRRRRSIDERIADFVLGRKASVPVQAETR
ncbi:alpha/beta hydrolase [Altererythrobacter sp.]|uniref:alpha/beta hydrolase n=1 Tax=Altererythrobacter sp. TaxID=1872480 RepID=UPI003CFD1484